MISQKTAQLGKLFNVSTFFVHWNVKHINMNHFDSARKLKTMNFSVLKAKITLTTNAGICTSLSFCFHYLSDYLSYIKY